MHSGAAIDANPQASMHLRVFHQFRCVLKFLDPYLLLAIGKDANRHHGWQGLTSSQQAWHRIWDLVFLIYVSFKKL